MYRVKRKRPPFLNLSHLHILLAIAEHASFSEAALQLEMSQSAVSSAIATLEDQLGVVLFSRGRHGAQLTPTGERIMTHVRQMIRLQDDIFKDANLARSLEGGEVRISSFRSVASQILPEIIAQFYERYPHIAVKLVEYFDDESIENDLLKGRADIGFTEVIDSKELDSWEFMQDEYIAVLPPTFQPAGSTLSWEELAQQPFIMASEGDGCDREVFVHCAAYGVALHIAYHVKSDSTIISMVARGLGATIIPRLAAEPIPNNVHVHSLPVPLFRSIRVATLAGALQPPPVFAFLDVLKESIRPRR